MQRNLLNGNSQSNNPYRNEDRSRSNNPYNNQNQTSSRPGMSQRPSNHLPPSSRAQPPPPIQISPSRSNYPDSGPRLQSQTNAYSHNTSDANQDWVGGVELGISPSSSAEHGLRSYGSSNSLNGGVYSSSSNSHGFGSSSSNLSHTDYDPDFSSNENVIGEYAINSPVWYQDSQDDGATRGLLSNSNGREDGFYSNPSNPGFGRSGAATSRLPSLTGAMNPRSASVTDASFPRHRTTFSIASTDSHSHSNSSSRRDSPPMTSPSHLHKVSASRSGPHSIFALPSNPKLWATIHDPEDMDDYLHTVHSLKDADRRGGIASKGFPMRAILNIGMLISMSLAILMLFLGYPVISYIYKSMEGKDSKLMNTGSNLGGINSTGQVAIIDSIRSGLIDPDTPKSEYTRLSQDGVTQLQLVFSDEFETPGRSFYQGDDPYWEAVDLWYWATNNYEWYDPAAITTSDGKLQITLSETPDHEKNFRGGMLQSWNKFCFTGGLLIASVTMPGSNSVPGLWPAFWAMGNLGRAGYGATLEGTWPYTYDACDVGTLQNQTTVDNQPASAADGGDVQFNQKHNSKANSFAPGQRLSACTCPDDDHPGPKMPDGSWKGRGAPEIDVFEAQVSGSSIGVSQSLQLCPFNYDYEFSNTTGPAWYLHQNSSQRNSYTGEVTQQSASGTANIMPQSATEKNGGGMEEYGFEYLGGQNGYVKWISSSEPSWELTSAALEADPRANISNRIFPAEPMYILLNVGSSANFGYVDWKGLTWPNTMSVDWVRVYQDPNNINVGCDPPDFPTQDYINRHMEAYTNADLELWGNTASEGGYGQDWPRNNLNPQGCNAPLSKYPGSPVQPKAKAPYYKSSEIGKKN